MPAFLSMYCHASFLPPWVKKKGVDTFLKNAYAYYFLYHVVSDC